MSFEYNLTAIEILKKLGYTKTKDVIIIDNKGKEIVIPSILREFLSLAINYSLFSTSDIWVSPYIHFLYDDIEEMIEEEKEYWENNSDDNIENEYYKFYKLPKDNWEKIVPNYLLIGSDFAAGIVEFGICITDLDKNNPPVYINHECDLISEWKLFSDSLSSFLMKIFCDVLSCEMYDTAVEVLEDDGWNVDTLSKYELGNYNIDFDAILKYPSLYDDNALLSCVYNKDNNMLLIIKFDESGKEILKCIAYSRE